MIDSTYVKDYQYSYGARVGNQIISKIKGNLISKISLVVNEYGIPINFIVMDGLHADCKKSYSLNQKYQRKVSICGSCLRYKRDFILS